MNQTRLPERSPVPGVIARAHSPSRDDWRDYRPCLRLDFEFTCGYCLCHEADLAEFGAVGSGVFSIEHVRLRSRHTTLVANDYRNCVYACRYCNGARSTRRDVEGGIRLLDPGTDAWRVHFRRAGNRLRPVPSSARAVRTHAVYDIDDLRKRAARHMRFCALRSLRRAERDAALIDKLLARAESAPPGRRRELIDSARALRAAVMSLRRYAERYLSPPTDAPLSCACERAARQFPRTPRPMRRPAPRRSR